jgi:hypothetical protein
MTFAIEIDNSRLQRLADATAKARKNMKKELAAAINAVSKKTKLEMGRAIRNTVAMKKDESEKPLSIRANASESSLQAVVSLKKTPRLGLRHFGARQDKRGVTYKIAKQGGRSRANSAFSGPKPGVVKLSWKGNAFKRTGKNRLPIVQIKGVSAYGAYVKNELAAPQAKAVEAELTKQIERRINLNVLRASGLVKT